MNTAHQEVWVGKVEAAAHTAHADDSSVGANALLQLLHREEKQKKQKPQMDGRQEVAYMRPSKLMHTQGIVASLVLLNKHELA